MDLDSNLCFCFHLKKRKIVNYVRQNRPRRASQISECFGAGTGCGWCIPFLKRIHRQVLTGESVEEELTAEQYEALRKGYLRDIQEGTGERNDRSQLGEELDLPDSAFGPPGGREDEDDDWDVSDFFSRRSMPPEGTEPDDLN